jgi:hypothetical protein
MTDLTAKLEAIRAFKDWSNYLLVTTITALGWVATSTSPTDEWVDSEVILLALSAIFGILTLALVPIVAERITDQTRSIYQIKAPFTIFYLWGRQVSARLKMFCWPQHGFLILAIAIHAFRYLKRP